MSTDEMVFLNVEKQIKNISYYFRSIDRKKLHIPLVKYSDITSMQCNALQKKNDTQH